MTSTTVVIHIRHPRHRYCPICGTLTKEAELNPKKVEAVIRCKHCGFVSYTSSYMFTKEDFE